MFNTSEKKAIFKILTDQSTAIQAGFKDKEVATIIRSLNIDSQLIFECGLPNYRMEIAASTLRILSDANKRLLCDLILSILNSDGIAGTTEIKRAIAILKNADIFENLIHYNTALYALIASRESDLHSIGKSLFQ
ncbi:MAG: hypothetical protein K0S09_1901 [Sphingobacteriaceae bacterium]|jgi:hypothetical protein|nr:hypothetical protein [Sphingobacteriaceae bacterium]